MTLDPISDMLTTIRNGLKARLYSCKELLNSMGMPFAGRN